MAKSSRLIILVLFIAWSGTAYAEAPAVREAADLRTAGEIEGIIDFCGVQGETGSIADLVGESFSATVGATGVFRLRYVPEGAYSLRIRIHNQPPIIEAVQVVKNQVTNVGTIFSCADYDLDGFTPDPNDPVDGNDCNDNNAAINPYAAEICDGYDNDCDGQVDGPGCTWCTDVDNDGFFAQVGCGAIVDCNDDDDTVRPNAPELCDGLDNNCDGVIDDGFDLQADPQNCGQCSHVCDESDCISGACSCPSGEAECAPGWCVDLSSNPQHCGACGQQCDFGYDCVSGECTGCPADQTQCGSSCVDLSSNSENCGACGAACQAGAVCLDGTCAGG